VNGYYSKISKDVFVLLILLTNIQWTGHEIIKPEKLWISNRHPKNLKFYIAAANLKLLGGTETANLPT